MMKNLLSLVCLLVLIACADAPPAAVKLATFDSSPPIKLDVLVINVVDHAPPPDASSPYNTNNFQPTISNAVRDWATHHFVAIGSTGEAVVAIDDASLSNEKLPYSSDIFARKQANKYIGHASVQIQVSGREGSGNVTAEASRFQTLPEGATPVERTNAYNTVLNGLMHDLTDKLDVGARTHLNAFTISAPILNNNY